MNQLHHADRRSEPAGSEAISSNPLNGRRNPGQRSAVEPRQRGGAETVMVELTFLKEGDGGVMEDIWKPPTMEELSEIYVAQGVIGVQAQYRKLRKEYLELACQWTELREVAEAMEKTIKDNSGGEE